MSRILTASILGDNWKYFVVSLAIAYLVVLIVAGFTGDQSSGLIGGIIVFFGIWIWIYNSGIEAQKDIDDHKLAQVKRRDQLASSLKIDEWKCPSCLSPISAADNHCENCGYKLKN